MDLYDIIYKSCVLKKVNINTGTNTDFNTDANTGFNTDSNTGFNIIEEIKKIKNKVYDIKNDSKSKNKQFYNKLSETIKPNNITKYFKNHINITNLSPELPEYIEMLYAEKIIELIIKDNAILHLSIEDVNNNFINAICYYLLNLYENINYKVYFDVTENGQLDNKLMSLYHNSKNIVSFNYIEDLVSSFDSLKCNLVTFDGDVIKQKHLLTILYCLSENGCAIIKFMKIYDEYTYSLFKLFVHIFEITKISKPSLSDQTQEKHFLICRGYKGQKYGAAIVEILKNNENFTSLLNLNDVSCINVLKKISENQIKFIERDNVFFKIYNNCTFDNDIHTNIKKNNSIEDINNFYFNRFMFEMNLKYIF